jgi:hypothetical protein
VGGGTTSATTTTDLRRGDQQMKKLLVCCSSLANASVPDLQSCGSLSLLAAYEFVFLEFDQIFGVLI